MADNHPLLGDFTPMDRDDFIQHYGVKGMKWGKRKKRSVETSSSTSSAPARQLSDDYKTARSLKGKSSAELSNKELQTLVSRMNLEQQYARLNPTPPTTQKVVTDILANTGKQLASEYSKKLVVAGVKAAFKK